MKERDGYIDMRFVKRDDRTVAERIYREGNSRVSSAIMDTGVVPVYFFISTGGGYVEGEDYLQTVHLDKDAHAVITSQAPNYVYKCDKRLETKQKTEITIKEGATLEYYLDEVVPYESAYYLQDTEITMAKGSSLILTDGITGGWSKDGDPFKYYRVGLKTQIKKDGKLLLNDFLLCQPEDDLMAELGYFEGRTNFNSVVIIDDGLSDAMIAEMHDLLDDMQTTCKYGLTRITGGVVLRILGDTYHDNRHLVWAFINFYREHIKSFEPINLRKTGVKIR
ncbi:urease accessory protein UreD [Streptococcus sp. zg-JUN1979]|uniref:urease accessory protein UreD n=1 Tax=Streptococcus sp. zg-JUN1979 TaxID=3391450 RepID=UPI0039A4EBA0